MLLKILQYKKEGIDIIGRLSSSELRGCNNSNIMIRKANLEDLDELIKLYRGSIKKNDFKKISQWDYEYPNKEVLKKDILAQNYYVFFDQDEIIGGVTIDENIDTAYKNIKWKNNCFYTIHRLVVKHNRWGIGIGKKLMLFC